MSYFSEQMKMKENSYLKPFFCMRLNQRDSRKRSRAYVGGACVAGALALWRSVLWVILFVHTLVVSLDKLRKFSSDWGCYERKMCRLLYSKCVFKISTWLFGSHIRKCIVSIHHQQSPFDALANFFDVLRRSGPGVFERAGPGKLCVRTNSLSSTTSWAGEVSNKKHHLHAAPPHAPHQARTCTHSEHSHQAQLSPLKHTLSTHARILPPCVHFFLFCSGTFILTTSSLQ